MNKHAHNFVDLTNKIFHRLIVIEYSTDKSKPKRPIWKCKCACGNISYAHASDLRSGKHKSCGCLQKEIASSHGMSRTRLYSIWKGMILRCTKINCSSYKKYGEKNILVCDRWKNSFENFRDDMYESYLEHIEEHGEKQTTLDRINSDGNYEPSNCRWANYSVQNNNKKKRCNQRWFVAIFKDNKKYTRYNIRRFAKKHNLNHRAISLVLNNKREKHKEWSFEYI